MPLSGCNPVALAFAKRGSVRVFCALSPPLPFSEVHFASSLPPTPLGSGVPLGGCNAVALGRGRCHTGYVYRKSPPTPSLSSGFTPPALPSLWARQWPCAALQCRWVSDLPPARRTGDCMSVDVEIASSVGGISISEGICPSCFCRGLRVVGQRVSWGCVPLPSATVDRRKAERVHCGDLFRILTEY